MFGWPEGQPYTGVMTSSGRLRHTGRPHVVALFVSYVIYELATAVGVGARFGPYLPSATAIAGFKPPGGPLSNVATRTFTHDIAVQYRDLDTRRHVNHVVYAAYCEQAKGEFFRQVLGVSLADTPTVVRSMDIDYRAPVDPDETVTVALTAVTLGESSLTLKYELAVEDRVVATAQTVSVYLGAESGSPEPLPAEWRAALSPYTGQ